MGFSLELASGEFAVGRTSFRGTTSRTRTPLSDTGASCKGKFNRLPTLRVCLPFQLGNRGGTYSTLVVSSASLHKPVGTACKRFTEGVFCSCSAFGATRLEPLRGARANPVPTLLPVRIGPPQGLNDLGNPDQGFELFPDCRWLSG